MAQHKVAVGDTNEAQHIKHVVKQRRTKKYLTFNVWLVIIAITAALGYVAGYYHYQVEAFIGPVFGYRVHSGSLDLGTLQETYNKLAANYDGKLDAAKLIQGANSGMVSAAGDTYTVYMSPSETTNYNNNLSGNVGGGIGAEVGLKNNKITIVRALPDNPAIKAGLAAGDIVLSVNDESTSSWTVDKAVSAIRGDEGTTVKITVQRGTEVKDYTITRATINNPSVESSVADGIGTLTISRFDSETGDLARTAAQNFKKQGVKAIILDLRGNGGGYVDAARDVVGLWLNDKVVVVERNGTTVRETLRTSDDAILNGLPTSVLVNSSSASASEIVAGALQDNKVAKIVGETTFGKGSVQELVSLTGGAQLKVTVAKWYTPNGKNISKAGITPDISASLTQANIDNNVDPQADAAKKALNL